MQHRVVSVEDGQAALAAAIGGATAVVAFTGAGISTECGVPDFRSPGTPWKRYPPISFADFVASPLARAEAWRRKFTMDDLYADARPGRTHRALAALVESGRVSMVVTQNIDGLHGASGLPPDRLVELHGNGTYARCLACGLRHDLAGVRLLFEADGIPPTCPCGGIVKSATVAFGQRVPPEALARAKAATLACDLFLVLGSSLVVQPAASLPDLASRKGARLVIVNRDPTPLDGRAGLLIGADVGAVFEPWCLGGGAEAAPARRNTPGDSSLGNAAGRPKPPPLGRDVTH